MSTTTATPPVTFMEAHPEIPVMAQRIQKDDFGRLFYLAEAQAGGLCLHCKAPGFFTGRGACYQWRPVSDFPIGTIVHEGSGHSSAKLYRVVHLGESYAEMQEIFVTDEDHSYSGLRATGERQIGHRQNIFVEVAGPAEPPLMIQSCTPR